MIRTHRRSGYTILEDTIAHTYTINRIRADVSVTQLIKPLFYEFPKEAMAKQVAENPDKIGNTAEEVKELWQSKADISSAYGSAIHLLLEIEDMTSQAELLCEGSVSKVCHLLERFQDIAKGYFPNDVVGQYVALKREHGWTNIKPEAIVFTKDLRVAGKVDHIHVLDPHEKIAVIRDYKTWGEKRSSEVMKAGSQMSAYQHILERDWGWTIEGREVLWWNHKKFTVIPVEYDRRVELLFPKLKTNI